MKNSEISILQILLWSVVILSHHGKKTLPPPNKTIGSKNWKLAPSLQKNVEEIAWKWSKILPSSSRVLVFRKDSVFLAIFSRFLNNNLEHYQRIWLGSFFQIGKNKDFGGFENKTWKVKISGSCSYKSQVSPSKTSLNLSRMCRKLN